MELCSIGREIKDGLWATLWGGGRQIHRWRFSLQRDFGPDTMVIISLDPSLISIQLKKKITMENPKIEDIFFGPKIENFLRPLRHLNKDLQGVAK